MKHPLRLFAVAAVFVVAVLAAPAPPPAEAAFPTQSFSPAPPLPTNYRAPVAVTLADGRVLVAGQAEANCTQCRAVIIFDPAHLTWTGVPIVGEPYKDLGFSTLTFLSDGRLLIAGGGTNGITPGVISASAYIFDPTTNQITTVAPMANARQLHAATLLPDGTVMVIGGRNGSDPTLTYLNSVEIYDPVANTWTNGPPMANAYSDIGAVTLPDGDVLVFGDAYAVSPETSERFDTATGTWSDAGALYPGANGSDHVVLADGRIMIMGTTFSPSQQTLIYDPATSLWQPAASMKGKRTDHSAILLPSGKVFVMGENFFGANLDATRVEVYDPLLNTWTSLDPPPRQSQWGQAAALLDDGTVLSIAALSGGFSNSSPHIESYGLDTDGDGYNDMNEQFLGESVGVFCSIKRADLTYDGTINSADIGRWAIFQRNSSPKVDRHDINGDGVLNPADQGLIASKYGQEITACP